MKIINVLCFRYTVESLEYLFVLPCSLRSLHLGSNQLSALPVELSKLRFLSVLVLNFNEFDEVPPSILRLPLLKALLMAGNMIRSVATLLISQYNLPNLYLR